MSVAQIVKLIEQLGIPILVSLVCGYALFFTLKFILIKFSGDFQTQLKDSSVSAQTQLRDIAAEIDEELRDARSQIDETKVILVRLVDRVRLLDQSLLEHDAVARTIWGLEPKTERKRTRSERRDELSEQLREIGTNGH